MCKIPWWLLPSVWGGGYPEMDACLLKLEQLAQRYFQKYSIKRLPKGVFCPARCWLFKENIGGIEYQLSRSFSRYLR